MDKLGLEAKDQAEKLYLQQSLCSLYNTLTYRQNPKLYAALDFQQTTSYLLLLWARNILIDGEASYLSQVAEMESIWETLPTATGSACPLSFSNEERRQMEVDVEGVVRGMEAMRSIKESMGSLFPEQGIVRAEDYESALDALAQIKPQVIQEFAATEQEAKVWQEVWPFGT